MDNVLEVKKVCKSYKNGKGKINALVDIDLTLGKGESLGIIGPSGSGKTTLLNIIGGLDIPTSGEVVINGKKILKFKDKELSKFRNKTIGFVFQFFNLQDYLKVYENVMIPMLFAGVKGKNAKIKAEELLRSVGLGERINHYPKQLSGGEMQRVAIARSLANDPSILLADEPTANLDKSSAQKILDIFDKISRKGVSIIMITHNPALCKNLTKTVNIEDGKLITKKQ